MKHTKFIVVRVFAGRRAYLTLGGAWSRHRARVARFGDAGIAQVFLGTMRKRDPHQMVDAFVEVESR